MFNRVGRVSSLNSFGAVSQNKPSGDSVQFTHPDTGKTYYVSGVRDIEAFTDALAEVGLASLDQGWNNVTADSEENRIKKTWASKT